MAKYSYEITGIFELEGNCNEDVVGSRLTEAIHRELKLMGAVPDERGFLMTFESTTATPPTARARKKNLGAG